MKGNSITCEETEDQGNSIYYRTWVRQAVWTGVRKEKDCKFQSRKRKLDGSIYWAQLGEEPAPLLTEKELCSIAPNELNMGQR